MALHVILAAKDLSSNIALNLGRSKKVEIRLIYRSRKNRFWSINNSGEILDKARDFNATSLSTYDFSTLYTTLPHNLIKDKRIDLI